MIFPVIAIPQYSDESVTPLTHPMTEEELSWYGEFQLSNLPIQIVEKTFFLQ